MALKETVFEPTADRGQSLAVRAIKRVGTLLDEEIHDPMDVVRLTRRGIPAVAVRRLAAAGVSQQDLSLVIHRSKLRRREAKREALTPEESGRWFRVAKIQALAIEVLGNEQKAYKWLHKPRRIFDGLSAMEMIQAEIGAQLVEEALGQLNAGYFA